MYSLFSESKKAKKEVIHEMNNGLNKAFNEFFLEQYPSAREELLRGGMSEETVDQILQDIKLEMQQEMILQAKKGLKQAVITAAKERQAKSSDTSGNPFEPESDAPEKSGV